MVNNIFNLRFTYSYASHKYTKIPFLLPSETGLSFLMVFPRVQICSNLTVSPPSNLSATVKETMQCAIVKILQYSSSRPQLGVSYSLR